MLRIYLSILLTLTAVHAQPWRDLYAHDKLLVLELTTDPAALETILVDTTYEIEIPAHFKAAGEAESIKVSVRRKSADLLEKDGFRKPSFKIDINEFKNDPDGADEWHGVKKLSLENGDDKDVVSEFAAWYMHRVAAAAIPVYEPGLAALVELHINGVNFGVYVNVEQRDKQFLKNHGLWQADQTWLYKQSDVVTATMKESPDGEFVNSAVFNDLCFSPFEAGVQNDLKRSVLKKGGGMGTGGDDGGSSGCSTPSDFTAFIDSRVHTDTLLTLAAVNAFTTNPDQLFDKGKNFYFVDYVADKRRYIPWDLDSSWGAVDKSIFAGRRGRREVLTAYQAELLSAERYRGRFKEIMSDLLPFFETAAENLASIAQTFSAALEADPVGHGVENAATKFNQIRDHVFARAANVRDQINSD